MECNSVIPLKEFCARHGLCSTLIFEMIAAMDFEMGVTTADGKVFIQHDLAKVLLENKDKLK